MIKSIELYTHQGYHYCKVEEWKIVNAEYEDDNGEIVDYESDDIEEFCFKVAVKKYDSEYTDIITNFDTWHKIAKLDKSYKLISNDGFNEVKRLTNEN